MNRKDSELDPEVLSDPLEGDESPAVTDIVSLDDLPGILDVLQDPSSHVQVLVDPWGDRF